MDFVNSNLAIDFIEKIANLVPKRKKTDARPREIFEISVLEHFYKNIIEKGYMVYNAKTLLEIELSTARTLYMLIEKLRFESLYLRLDTIYLIKRIPLKYTKKTISQTIRTLKRAFTELEQKGFIKSFGIIKDSTWEKSEVEIYLNQKVNEEKQERFYEDRNEFRKMLALTVSDMEQNDIDEMGSLEDGVILKKEIVVTNEIIEKVLDLMPKKAKNLKTMGKTIKEAIETHGYEKVEATAKYMKKNKVEKIRAYFLKALSNDWADEIGFIKEVKPIPKVRVEEGRPKLETHNEEIYKKYVMFPESVKEEIEIYLYKEYIKLCGGVDGKIQKMTFGAARKKIITTYLESHREILEKYKPKERLEIREEINIGEERLTDVAEIKGIITDTIEMVALLKNYTHEEKAEILTNILKDIVIYVQNKTLTRSILSEGLKKYTGI